MKLEKAQQLYNKICDVVQELVYSDVYMAALCLFVLLFWALRWTVAGLVVLIVLTCLILLFANDLSSLFLPIMGCLMVVREITEIIYGLWPLLFLFVPCAVVFAVRNHPQKVKLGTMFFPLVAVSVAFLIGGLGVVSANNYLRALPLSLCLGVGMLALYFVFVNFMNCQRSTDIALHYAKVCTYVGLLVGAELIIAILQSGLSPSEWTGSYWDVGWGNRGTIATFLPFGFVMSLYLATRAKKYSFIYMLVAFVEMLCLMLTMSRGGILFGTVAAVVAIVMSILKGNRKQLLICFGSVCAAVLLICVIFHSQVGKLLSGVAERFSEIQIQIVDGKLVISGTSGRFGPDGLYGKAIELFKAYPLLGVGVGGHPDVAVAPSLDATERFHSSVFEVMASLGIVGMLCYTFYYVGRFATVFKNGSIKKKFPLFAFITWIAFEGQSLIDMCTFEPVFMIFVTLQLAVLEVCSNCDIEGNTSVLWIWNKPRVTLLDGVTQLPNNE